MEERYVGRSGLRVSRLALGTMTWGRDTDEHEAADQLRVFLDAGGSLVDTAPSYADGASEQILGTLLGQGVDRDALVLATKGGIGRKDGKGHVDTSRRGLLRQLDTSLQHLGVGVLCWSPLGRGVLTGKYRSGVPGDSRGASAHFAPFVEHYFDRRSRSIVDAVVTAADGLGVSPVDVALAWARDRPGVASAVVGARTAAQLLGSLSAEEVVLPDAIRDALDDVSAPGGPAED